MSLYNRRPIQCDILHNFTKNSGGFTNTKENGYQFRYWEFIDSYTDFSLSGEYIFLEFFWSLVVYWLGKLA